MTTKDKVWRYMNGHKRAVTAQHPTPGGSNDLGAWPFPNWTTRRPTHQLHDAPPTTDRCSTPTRTYADMTTELGDAKW